jgi:hypothetical protein
LWAPSCPATPKAPLLPGRIASPCSRSSWRPLSFGSACATVCARAVVDRSRAVGSCAHPARASPSASCPAMAVDEYAGLREDAHEPRRKGEEAWLARRTHGHEEARRHACQITARRTRAPSPSRGRWAAQTVVGECHCSPSPSTLVHSC